MKNVNIESRGYKPQMLMETLQISRETLRYWRKNIHPKEVKSHFNFVDIFAYRIIKELVHGKKTQPCELGKLNWKSFIFSCYQISVFKLKNKILLIDFDKSTIELISSLDEIKGRNFQFVRLNVIVKEHYRAFEDLGESYHNLIHLQVNKPN